MAYDRKFPCLGKSIRVKVYDGKAKRLELYLSNSNDPFFTYDARTRDLQGADACNELSFILKHIASGRTNGRTDIPGYVRSYAKGALKSIKKSLKTPAITIDNILVKPVSTA